MTPLSPCAAGCEVRLFLSKCEANWPFSPKVTSVTSFIIDQAYGTKDTFVEFISVHLFICYPAECPLVRLLCLVRFLRGHATGVDWIMQKLLKVGGKWCGREAGESAVNTWGVRSAGSSERAREVKSFVFVKKKHNLYIFNVQPSQYPYDTSSCEKVVLSETVLNKYFGRFWCEKTTGDELFTGSSIITDSYFSWKHLKTP